MSRQPAIVRVRLVSADPFAGLRGHAYIEARGLAQHVQPNAILAPHTECQCAPCAQQRQLRAVQQICAARERRKITTLPQPHWNNLHDDAVHELLDDLAIVGG